MGRKLRVSQVDRRQQPSVSTEIVQSGILEGVDGKGGTAQRGVHLVHNHRELTGKDRRLSARTGRRRVMMLGLRGIPDVQGGIEKHVEILAGKLTKHGWDVDVIGRRRYLPASVPFSWNGIRVVPFWAPRRMALEAIVHTFMGVCYAGWQRPDVLHIHAIGPALFVPLARMLGLKVVVTHHGYDYDRQKWGALAKGTLKLGERLGMRFASGRIAISKDIAETMGARHNVSMALVPNGVSVTPSRGETGILAEFGLAPRRYILLAARIVPEKRQLDLIRAYAKCSTPEFRLVLAGGAEFETSYTEEVRRLAGDIAGVVLTGFQSGDRLAELFGNAALFVLPSSHEGMPIALLEAMAYGLPVLASDIVANVELGLARDEYFPLGDVEALASAMTAKLANPPSESEMRARAAHAEAAYSWTSVAEKTVAVYSALVAK